VIVILGCHLGCYLGDVIVGCLLGSSSGLSSNGFHLVCHLACHLVLSSELTRYLFYLFIENLIYALSIINRQTTDIIQTKFEEFQVFTSICTKYLAPLYTAWLRGG
jgi:hypothetical protein